MGLNLSLKEKIGQLFMVGFYGKELPEDVRRFIHDHNPGFVILFSRNVESLAQVVDLTDEIHALPTVKPFIFTDQEGGTVVQFREMAATVISPMGLAATGNPENSRIAGRIIGEEMAVWGLDGILAPVLDVNFEERNPIIGIRAFSDDPEMVIRFAQSFLDGLHETGILGCGKHYPGHGGTVEDSHLVIPEVRVSKEIFLDYCFKPFSILAQKSLDSIMTAHVGFPEISDQLATFSPYLVNQLLRETARYQGLVISDCMEMQSIKDNYSPAQMVENAIKAGIDVITVSHHLDFQTELFENLLFAVKKGHIDERRIDESISRVLAMKRKCRLWKKAKPKSRNIPFKKTRDHLELEQKLADGSVTVLLNERGVIPLDPKKKILILEWKKVKATQSISEAEDASFLERIAKKHFHQLETRLLPLDGKFPEDEKVRLDAYDHIIVGLYSRNPDIEKLQSDALNEIRKIRNDVIVVALGNPYDIRNFPGINTYIVTYGFRDVQLEALFRLIKGDIKPSGKLPVQISGLFPRGSGLV